ncbi:MAG: cupin domain-containing protein [Gammaproteobacteria bacterium]|nr:MAG: cupin [Gammaproteobacteria bacterium]UCH41368.1 MAG: cupin domain-containing protein [Gammaproteobacteria bacterium]
MSQKQWHFVHHEAADAAWSPGLRKIFEYRDLGIKDGTGGDYVAHVIRAIGREPGDQIHQWHYHDCRFQMVYILRGWVTFEYEGAGVRTLRAGDCINQVPRLRHREIECSEDLEMLEIVSPADFATEVVEAPD